MILIQFELLLQTFHFYLKVDNMVNVVLHSQKLLAISPLGFFLIAKEYNPLVSYLFYSFCYLFPYPLI